MMNFLIKARVWFDNVKYRLATATLLLLGNLPGAHAAGWFDILNDFEEGMKQARTPLMLILGTIGILSVAFGVIIIKDVNNPKKQNQNHGRGAMSGLMYIIFGILLVGLSIVIKRTGDKLNINTDI